MAGVASFLMIRSLDGASAIKKAEEEDRIRREAKIDNRKGEDIDVDQSIQSLAKNSTPIRKRK